MKKSNPSPAARLEAERRRVAASERAEPLRRRLLLALGEGDAISSNLAERVGSGREPVSRKLGDLRRDGLVTSAKSSDDGRHVTYSLTDEGRVELGRCLSLGKPRDLPAPATDEEKVQFLAEALDGAKTMRRRSHRLEEAIARLEDIRGQALVLGADGLALQALVELAITQRQGWQVEDRTRSLEIMEGLALGTEELESRLIYPAVAHLEYERGKGGDLGETDTAVLARHLITANSLFEALIENEPKSDARIWRTRRAWSVIGLAGNYRDQSRYEDALQYGSLALRMFDELGDVYGRTRCLLLFGICLRPLQRFDVAWTCLEQAHALASDKDNWFERSIAECLVQMGEVRRCQNRTDDARALLDDAFVRADRLGMDIAKAFATSATAASEFQDEELDRAQAMLKKAHRAFRGRHVEGIALNARRQATVARHLSIRGVAPDDEEIKRVIRLGVTKYELLGSPAGVAACEVERGWMRLYSADCGDVGEVVDRLRLILADEDAQKTIAQDPWVPAVLRRFSLKVGGPLEEATKGLPTIATRNIEQEAKKGVKSVSEFADGLDQIPGSKAQLSVVEMAGESRRRKAPPELTPA